MLIGHFWSSELDDYYYQRMEANIEPNESSHIFTTMAYLDSISSDVDKTAEEHMMDNCKRHNRSIPDE